METQTKDLVEGPEIAEKDLETFQRTPDGRRERPGGGGLGGVRALSKREGSIFFDTRPHGLGALLPQGSGIRYGTFQGPKHPADR